MPRPPTPTPTPSPTPTPLSTALRRDVTSAAAAALYGCAAAAALEYVATLVSADGVGLATAFRLLFLDVTLFGLFFLLAAPALAAAAAGARLLCAATGPQRAASMRGLFGPSRFGSAEPGAVAAWLWSLGAGAAGYVAASTALTLELSKLFKEPQLTALLLACVQVGLIAAFGAICFLLSRLLRRLGRRLHPRLGAFNPLGSAPAAAALLILLAAVAVKIAVKVMPQMAPLVPWRQLLAAIVFAGGAWASTVISARRASPWPTSRRARRIATGGATAFAVVVAPLTLLVIGADSRLKTLAISSDAGSLSTLVNLVRRANDLDGDGYGSLLGESDCAPLDPTINRLAAEIPDDGIDQNCDGTDFKLGELPSYRKGVRMPVPDAYLRDWNFLLITVDTVRYDHTTMGGYDEERGRDTTPNLARFAGRSVSFDFAQAPSAGTMASIPAILTSRFFHSGVALGPDRRGKPPVMLPENVLLSEILKRGDYTTGAITSHYYFNEWKMDQGFDTFDNEIGRENKPRAVTSPQITDRALQWIGRRTGGKWFLWVHYIDPHGYYVPHPGEKSYGTSEEDLYDGELHFTDKHLGRLLDELRRLPGGDRTVVAITSDHGDGFNEHGFINHGSALYKEILHVPLIVYVPNIQPRTVEGAVSAVDIVPTFADLAGIDVSDLSFEGESLVPQLFYKQDAHDRVVFAETNIPQPQRAAVTSRYKLIYKLHSNVYELYDLRQDPWEKKNLWPSKDPKGFREMKGYLDDWLERVYYARDAKMNQAMRKIEEVLLSSEPEPSIETAGVAFDGRRIEVLGLDADRPGYEPGELMKVTVYFKVRQRPTGDFRLQLEAWTEGDSGGSKGGARRRDTRSRLRLTKHLPSSHWRGGEFIRDQFKLRIPRSWATDKKTGPIRLGLRMSEGRSRKAVKPSGPTREGDPDVAVLGEVPLERAAAAEESAPVAPLRRGRTGGRGP